jgi:glycerol-3-phosphate cytidylyltransferase
MPKRFRKAITYGTFDLPHVGHVKLLRRIAAMADSVVVGVSSDAFNALKGKRTIVPYEERAEIVAAFRYVDAVFSEQSWDQKRSDILREQADVLVMGDDWSGRFDELRDVCEVIYLPRTDGVSTTRLLEYIRQDFELDGR